MSDDKEKKEKKSVPFSRDYDDTSKQHIIIIPNRTTVQESESPKDKDEEPPHSGPRMSGEETPV